MKITYCDPDAGKLKRIQHKCPLCNCAGFIYDDEKPDKIVAFLMTLSIPGYTIDLKKDVSNGNMESQKELSHSGASS